MASDLQARPCLKRTVVDLIRELRDSAELRRIEGDENGELAFSAAAERVAEVFADFGSDLAKCASAPEDKAGRGGAFIRAEMRDRDGASLAQVTWYASAPGSPVTRGHADHIDVLLTRLGLGVRDLLRKQSLNRHERAFEKR